MAGKYRTLLMICAANALMAPISVPLSGEGSAPFLAAFLCALAANGKKARYFLPGLAAGCFLAAKTPESALIMMGCAFLCAVLNENLLRKADRQRDIASALCAFVSAIAPALFFYTGGAFALMRVALRGLIALCLTPVFATACARRDGAEVRLSRCVLYLIALAGLARLSPQAGLFLSAFTTLLLCASGPAAGALTGALTGAACMLSPADAGVLSLLSLSGLCAGVASGIGAWASALAFIACLPLYHFVAPLTRAVWLFAAVPVALIVPAGVMEGVGVHILGKKKATPLFCLRACKRHLSASGIGVCGDSGLIRALPNGQWMLILSDGMGTGEAAARQSAHAIRVANTLLSGVKDEEMAAQAVNRLIMENEKSESYATLDVCTVDLVSGSAQFRKFGGEPSWLLSGDRLTRVNGGALPMGILMNVKGAGAHLNIKHRDTIVMATDGVIHAFGGADAFERALAGKGDMPPEALCQSLMRRARAAKNAHPDDMSVLCAQIEKRKFPQSLSLNQVS